MVVTRVWASYNPQLVHHSLELSSALAGSSPSASARCGGATLPVLADFLLPCQPGKGSVTPFLKLR